MMQYRISQPKAKPNKEKIAGIKGRRQLQPFLWLCSALIGVSLMLLAFPIVAQACRNFSLQILGPDMARPGDEIVYTIQYQNLDWPLLTNVTLTGQIPEHTTLVSAPPACQQQQNTLVCHIGQLTQGQGGEASVILRVNESTPAETVISSKVTAMGKEPGQKPMVLNSAQTYTEIVIPALAITLQPSASAIYCGEQVTYTYVVTNTSDVALQDVTIVDDQKSPSTVCASMAQLESGHTFTCTWTTAPETDITSVATATGLDPWGDPVTDTDSATVRVIVHDVTISITLTASAPRIYTGDTVTYTYTVSNAGADVAYNVVIKDDRLGTIAGPFDLAGGASAAHTISDTLDEDTTNVATATAQDSLGKSLVATASAFVDTIQRPGPNGEGILSLTVTASATAIEAGKVVTYTYVLTNLSQDPVNRIIVLDDQFGSITSLGSIHPLDVPQGFTLQGGESCTLTLATPLHESTKNVAIASGQDLLEQSVLAEATTFVQVITAQPLQKHVIFLPLILSSGP
jgi:uncharacterized repeat protein (TIGR01451 family)